MSVLASKQTLIFLTFTQYCSNATVLENYIALSSPKSIDQLKNRQKNGIQIGSYDMTRQQVIHCDEREKNGKKRKEKLSETSKTSVSL